MARELSVKQKRFVEIYDGNGTKSAKLAGYAGSANVLAKTAFDLLRKPNVREEIDARENTLIDVQRTSRQALQNFWASVVYDQSLRLTDRLKASELLGRSLLVFNEAQSASLTLEELITGQRKSDY